MAVLAYLAAGIAFWTTAGKMTFVNALYFIIVTLTTVGYGDLRNHGDGVKLFACFYIVLGSAIVISLLGHLVSKLLDTEESAFVDAFLRRNTSKGKGRPDSPFLHGRRPLKPSSWSADHYKLVVSIATFALLVAGGTVVFALADKLDFVDSFYLVFVSVTTVGYGDFAPRSVGTKVFAIFYLPIATLSLAKVIGDCVRVRAAASRASLEERVLARDIDRSLFAALDVDGDDRVRRYEFLAGTLVAQEKVTRAEIDSIMRRFHELDVSRTGFLSHDDLGHAAHAPAVEAEAPEGASGDEGPPPSTAGPASSASPNPSKMIVPRALALVGFLSIAHVLVLGPGAALLPRDQAIGAALGLPRGFGVVDLADGAFSVLVAGAHQHLLRAQAGGRAPTRVSAAHAALCGLLVLAEGAHMIANPLDEGLLDAASTTTAAERLRLTAYWQHEFLCHRLFAWAVCGLWLLASWTDADASADADAGADGTRTRALAVVHGLAFGFFSVGTRTAAICAPCCIALAYRWCGQRAGGRVAAYAGAMAGAQLAVFGPWFVYHHGSMPTFDDLRHGPTEVSDATSSAAAALLLLVAFVLGASEVLFGAPDDDGRQHAD